MTITCRLADINDAEHLFDWRNDPTSRKYSISTEEIEFASHIKWLENSLLMNKRVIWIFEFVGRPIATSREDYFDDLTSELSWAVAPDSRGKGYGLRIVDLTLQNSASSNFLAVIKSENVPSINIVKKLGFKLKNEDEGIQKWELKK